MTFLIFLTLFLLFCSGFFSASETALFSLSPTKIKTFQFDLRPERRLIAKLVLHPRELLVTIFMLNTLVNILLQNVISHSFGQLARWEYRVGVPLVLTLIFGEIIPKYIGLQNNLKLSYIVSPLINLLQNFLSPLRKIIVAVTDPISRILFFFLKKDREISKEELQHVLKTSQQSGLLDHDEVLLVSGYLDLQEAIVKELMWPREDMLFYDIQEPLSKLNHLFVDQECTRLPICDKNIDNVLGILTANQYFIHREELTTPNELRPFLAKPFFVPETTPARLLIKQFEERKGEIALVVDEYGSISGLITFEDLIEIVIGPIADRRDQKNLYTRSGENTIIASGKLELEEFNQIFKVELTSASNMSTIGGWLTEHLGFIPKSGIQYKTDEFLFKVLDAAPNRIRRLYIRKLKKL